MEQLRRETPGFEAETNKKIRDYILMRKRSAARMAGEQATLYHIPVVVHVIHTGGVVGTTYNPTDATITSAIDYLNAVFNGTWTGTGGSILGAGDMQIQFVLATKDPAGNPTTGINRINGSSLSGYTANGITIASDGSVNDIPVKDLSRWDPKGYYNIWIVNKINGQDGTTPGVAFTAGYAYFPYHNNSVASTLLRDGIVMLATQMRSGEKTLPHEFGHAFNLYHTFQGETNVTGALNGCPSNSSPSTQGDWCSDTDPVINPADDGYGATAFSCRTGTNPCTTLPYNDNTEKNFMNYTSCYQLFTSEQRARMQAALSVTTRKGLAVSWANNQGTYPTTWTPPAPAVVTPTSTDIITYDDWLGIMNINLNGKKIFTLNSYRDNGYVDNTKWYNLIALQPNTTYTMEVDLLNSGNYEQFGLWIDYNGDGAFNEAEEKEYYTDSYINTLGTEMSTLSFSFTTPASFSGNVVRMRVMNDFSSRYTGMTKLIGSSSSIVGGQAEDYPVFLMNVSPMPVTLVDFSGNTTSGNTNLSWTTSTELNAKEYEVQRSSNGDDFTTIGTVGAKGNTYTETTYQYTDYHVGSGTHLYRLKMIDQNESFKFSKTLQFTIESRVDVQVIGNPFTNSIKLVLPDHKGTATVRLFDAVGKLVLTHSTAQSTTVDLPVNPQLPKGLYILETIVNNQRYMHKLIKE
jgi:hypothetical protein